MKRLLLIAISALTASVCAYAGHLSEKELQFREYFPYKYEARIGWGGSPFGDMMTHGNGLFWRMSDVDYWDRDGYIPSLDNMYGTDGPEKVWTFISAEKIHTTIREMERDGLNCWRVNALCNDSGINGITSLSQTSPEGVVVRQWLDSYITRYSVSGIFTTEIYDGQKKVDFCTCTFRPGFDASYQTGR